VRHKYADQEGEGQERELEKNEKVNDVFLHTLNRLKRRSVRIQSHVVEEVLKQIVDHERVDKADSKEPRAHVKRKSELERFIDEEYLPLIFHFRIVPLKVGSLEVLFPWRRSKGLNPFFMNRRIATKTSSRQAQQFRLIVQKYHAYVQE
jgi:hypothetical protein